MKTFLAIIALFIAASAWSDGQATLSFSGKGKGPIEVRDHSANASEVVPTAKLQLNQIPADAIAREEAFRAERAKTAQAIQAKRAEAAAANNKAAAEAAEGAKKSDADSAAAAAAQAKLTKEEHPRKVRGKTVRGTRFVAKPDAPAEEGSSSTESSPAQPDAPAADTPPGPRS